MIYKTEYKVYSDIIYVNIFYTTYNDITILYADDTIWYIIIVSRRSKNRMHGRSDRNQLHNAEGVRRTSLCQGIFRAKGMRRGGCWPSSNHQFEFLAVRGPKKSTGRRFRGRNFLSSRVFSKREKLGTLYL